MTNKKKISSVFKEFYEILNSIIGVYFDSTLGFDLHLQKFEENRNKILKISKETDPEKFTNNYLDTTSFFYAKGDPNKNPEIYHETTQAEFKLRNAKNGKNYKFIGNICLITIYQYWEDYFRQKLAKVFNKQKGDINSDIFGDIRIIRHSIIHHNSIALPDIKKCKILKWFKEGDEIFINQEKLIEIFNKIKTFEFGVTH